MFDKEIVVPDKKEFLRNNKDKPQYSRLCAEFIEAMAQHLTNCTSKYPDSEDGTPNWKQPVKDKNIILDSIFRHLNSRFKNEEFDKESGAHHSICIAVNAMFDYFHSKKID